MARELPDGGDGGSGLRRRRIVSPRTRGAQLSGASRWSPPSGQL
ncbi:hypothetical protein LINGRAHAP2_LOCUS36239 [Linum grandiflorum]